MKSPAFQRRSKAVIVALAGWWFAAICALVAWVLFSREAETAVRVGTWMVGFAAVGTLAGWAGSVGSLLHDRGRIRAGGLSLMLIPFLGIIFSWWILRSTTISARDPIPALWVVLSAVVLIVATGLVVAPLDNPAPEGKPRR